jgi:DNA-directed RNA polymerase subunit RPC12/RpoP
MLLKRVYCPACGRPYDRDQMSARQSCEDCRHLFTITSALHEPRASRISRETLENLSTDSLFLRHGLAERAFNDHYRYCTRAKRGDPDCATCSALIDNVGFFESELERRADLAAGS